MIGGSITLVDVPRELVPTIETALRRHGRELRRVVGDVLAVGPPAGVSALRVSLSDRPYDGRDGSSRRAT